MKDRRKGLVEALWIKRMSRGPMDPVERAELVEDVGILGNADQGGRRQVTLLSREAWTRAMGELGTSVEPATRRANVLISGIDLERSRDRTLALGACRVRIRGETRPCTLLEAAQPGLRDALDPEWRGGAFSEVVRGGYVAVGDPVSWIEDGR